MSANIGGVQVPPGATVDIHIHISAPVNITPFIARQKVAAFVLSEISTQLLADTPVLNVGERLFWSVPVVLTSPAGASAVKSAKSSSLRLPASYW